MERACQSLLAEFTERSREILGDNLTGIYLHGSLAMGCFCWQESDIDLLVTVKNPFPDAQKRRYMDMVTELNGRGPAKGIELSVIRESVCRPPVYPTPFELHFSIAHLDWYRRDPGDYIRKMKGTDKDLAAHIMILYYRGKPFSESLAGRCFCRRPTGIILTASGAMYKMPRRKSPGIRCI